MQSRDVHRLSFLALAFICFGELVGSAAQQTVNPVSDPREADQPVPPAQPPLNPTQEVAGQEPEGNAIAVGPAKLRLGGYVGLTGLYRSTNSGGGTGTRFAFIPYGDELQGNVSETRLTAESSRLSIRVDADFSDDRARFRSLAGYFEMDFSGTAPGNVEVSSSSVGLRLRNAFAEVRYGESFYLSAGQAFTLMTAQKNQISMWPSDIELSQAIDTNYLAGMVWARLPQLRLTWRPSKVFSWAASIENPEQQLGSDLVTLPTCCASDIEAQFNIGSNQTSVPDVAPDFVSRVSFNPSASLHIGVGGVLRVFRNSVAPYTDSFKQTGGGVNIDAAVRVTGTTRILAQSAFGPGLGRYIGALAPDVVFHKDGSISPVFTTSWVGGIEQRVTSRASLAGYYSGLTSDSNYSQDVDGDYIGFGFPGSPNSNNRKIQELTGTFSTLTVTTENRGSTQIGIQVSWLKREPWSRGSGPAAASEFVFFAQVRYNLP
jgi:hypothetical protein